MEQQREVISYSSKLRNFQISEAESNLNTDRGEMTVPLLRKTQVMVSFGEVQSCNENGYIIRGSGLA